MDREQIRSINQNFLSRIITLENKHSTIGLAQFRHISRNLLQVLYNADSRGFNPETDQDRYNNISNSLEQYLELIETRTDFRDKEMHTESGYFPNTTSSFVSERDYVAHAVDYFRTKTD